MKKEECISEIKKLTGKTNVTLTYRGSTAIQAALIYARNQGKTTVLLQDAGGWINYPKDCEKAKLSMKYIPTADGLISPDTIRTHGDENCVLLLTSSAGYHALQDMKGIMNACREKDVMIVNDASGSIGEFEAKVGDIIVSSFGKWKPLDLGKGGFLATSLAVECEECELDYKKLLEKLTDLPQRLNSLYNDCNKIKEDLKDHTIIHPESKGTVVIVAYHGEEEMNTILAYCEKNGLEHTTCPREIRVLCSAISIEVKRKQYK